MSARVTQAAVEVLSRTTAPAHVTQAAVEVLSATHAGARVTQALVEVLWRNTQHEPLPCEPLPPWIALGATGGPEYAVSVFTAPGGWEARVQHWPQVRGRWDISFVHRSAADIATLLAFFRAVAQGRAQNFCFTDGTDYTFHNRIGIGDGATTAFQLVKVYQSGTLTYRRPLTRPVVSTLLVAVNGVPTTAYTLAAVGGRVVFDSPPPSGAVIEARGEFEVLVRFDTDNLQITCVTLGVFSCAGLGLVELVGE